MPPYDFLPLPPSLSPLGSGLQKEGRVQIKEKFLLQDPSLPESALVCMLAETCLYTLLKEGLKLRFVENVSI